MNFNVNKSSVIGNGCPTEFSVRRPSWSSAFTEEEMRMINELQARVEASKKPTVTPCSQKALDILADLQISCLTMAEDCTQPENIIKSQWPLRNVTINEGCPEVDRLVETCADSVTSQLDDAIASVICNSRRRPKDEHIWASFVIRDMSRVIDSIADQCEGRLRQKTADTSYVRPGRVFAWSREQRSTDSNDEEANALTTQLRTQLRRRLAKMVWLMRASKRRARSHPLLASMKHELLRIRTRAVDELFRERAGTVVPIRAPLLQLEHEHSSEAALRSLIPSEFYDAFEQLIERLTATFMELPPQVPGIFLSDELEDLNFRRQFLREVISRTILGFYDHLDASAVIEAEAPGSTLVFSQNLESGESGLEEDGEPKEQGVRPLTLQLNPALVQAVLDRFDHHSYASRKRAMTATMSVFQEEDRLASVDVTDSDIPAMDITREDDQTEEILNVLRGPVACAATAELSEEEQIADTLIRENRQQTPPIVYLRTVSPSPVKTDVVINQHRPTKTGRVHARACKPKPVRSLRTRGSRTPSDNSFSEGEVLSDSEEERPASIGETEEPVTDLGERTNVDIEEEEAEELIRMVNEQLRDRTPASDIDLTELEIMDEWAPPASSMAVVGRTETERTLSDAPSGRPEPLSAEALAALEEANRKLTEIVENALSECRKGLGELVLCAEQNTLVELDATPSQPEPSILAEDTEANIERTASVFQEHVTAILTNLLHAIPLANDSANDFVLKMPDVLRPKAAPVISGRRGSRLMGMLRAYQQDIVKRMSTSVK